MGRKLLLAAVVLLPLAGMVVCHYLILSHLTVLGGAVSEELFCGGTGLLDCNDLPLHPASSLLGRPLPVWGILFYFSMLGLGIAAVAHRGMDRKAIVALGFITSTIALLFDAYLGVVMVTQIGALCPNCLVTYGINLALVLSYRVLDRRTVEALRWSHLLPSWRALRQGSLADYYRNAVKAGSLLVLAGVLALVFFLTTRPFDELKARSREELNQFLMLVLFGQPQVDMARFEGQPSIGPAEAPIQVAVAADFQCDFCRSLANQLLRLQREAPESLRVSFVNLPVSCKCNPEVPTEFHEDACWLAEAGEAAAEQGRFWDYHDLVYDGIRFSKVSEETVFPRLVQAGIDAELARNALESGRTRDAVSADIALCSELGITATPSLVVNGRVKRGAAYPGQLEELFHVLAHRALEEQDGGGEEVGPSLGRNAEPEAH